MNRILSRGKKENENEKEALRAGEKEEEFALDPGLVDFLDADSYEKKLQILSTLHNRITDAMIDTMAVSLDTEVKEGDIETRYAEIRNCLQWNGLSATGCARGDGNEIIVNSGTVL